MTEPIEPGDRVLFMKVGIHATEDLASIIERKQREIDDAGFAFWGYGGNTCHPTRMVQPFALAGNGPIILAMNPMVSNHAAEPIRAEEYSADGVNWLKVPDAINCVGSRHALIIDSLVPVETDIDLSRARVAVGPSRGKLGSKYIQGRVDKACFDIVDKPEGDPKLVRIGFRANLAAPYAVFLKS